MTAPFASPLYEPPSGAADSTPAARRRSASSLRRLPALAVVTIAVAVGFVGLGALASTPLLGLVWALLTVGLAGLGSVMV